MHPIPARRSALQNQGVVVLIGGRLHIDYVLRVELIGWLETYIQVAARPAQVRLPVFGFLRRKLFLYMDRNRPRRHHRHPCRRWNIAHGKIEFPRYREAQAYRFDYIVPLRQYSFNPAGLLVISQRVPRTVTAGRNAHRNPSFWRQADHRHSDLVIRLSLDREVGLKRLPGRQSNGIGRGKVRGSRKIYGLISIQLRALRSEDGLIPVQQLVRE